MAGGGAGFTPSSFSPSRNRQRISPLPGPGGAGSTYAVPSLSVELLADLLKGGPSMTAGQGHCEADSRELCLASQVGDSIEHPLRSAIGLAEVDRRAAAPAPRSAGTTRPRLSHASRRGRSRRPRFPAASARPAAAPSATRPSRDGGGGDTRRRRRRCGRHPAPRLRSRPVPRARRRCAPRAGTRLRRSARAAFCRRAQGPACSSRPGCIRDPSPAATAR